MTPTLRPIRRRAPTITAAQLDDIKRNYGHQRTRVIARRLGISPVTVTKIANAEGVRMTREQMARVRSPYWRGTA